MRPADPDPYGRFILAPDGTLERIVEATDANNEERALGLVNGGIMVIEARHARDLVDVLDRNNAKREFYLTDIVEIARGKGLNCGTIELPADELIGINSRAELAEAEALMQRRLRRAAMDAGVTLVAPETVFLSADTKLGRDVVIEPNVTFSSGVTVGRARGSARSPISKAPASEPARSSGRARSSSRGCMSAISSRSRQPASARASRPITSPISATARSAHAPISAPARSPAITAALTNSAQ
jgi:NDP-sugar pyrophosphorylase family protein